MLTLRPGNQIQSPNVDPNRTYANRNIENLARLGALGVGEGDLLNRVDGVIDNRPVDGKVDIDEMVRMEQGAYQAALFPDEQRVLPGLWRHMQWDPVAPAPALPAQVRLQDQIQERVGLPAGLDFAQNFDINLLSQGVQRSARRVQLVLNGDGNAQTIAIPDVDAAVAAPGRFTAQDVEDFKKIRDELAALVRQAQAQLRAELDVPTPGITRTVLPHAGRTQVRLVADTQLQETRSLTRNQPSNGMQVSLQAIRKSGLEVEVPANMQALLIDTRTGTEQLFEPGIAAAQLAEGTYRVELWQNGARVESSEVNVPAVTTERVDLTKYLGFDLTTNGQPLNRNVTFAAVNQALYGAAQITDSARWSWETQPQAAPAGVDAHVLARLKPPAVNLQPGRYETALGAHGQVQLDVFPSGVLRVSVGGRKINLVPINLDRTVKFSNPDMAQAQKRVIFDPVKNELTMAEYVNRDYGYVSAVLTAAQRIA